MDSTNIDAGQQDRAYWVTTMSRIAEPVLTALARRQLKATMPVEARTPERASFARLEAIGRVLTGIAPWLEAPHLDAQEEALRQRYAQLACLALDAATDQRSPTTVTFRLPFNPSSIRPFSPMPCYAHQVNSTRNSTLVSGTICWNP